MNESEKSGTIGEAVVGLFFVFTLIIFLIYKFGYTKETVTNPTENKVVTLDTVKESVKGEQASPLFNSYVDQIFENKKTGNIVPSETLEKNMKKDLDTKVILPEFSTVLANVGNFSANKYLSESDNLYELLKKNGGGSEVKIFSSQILNQDETIPLSDFDRGTILRISTEYEIFAEKISNLETPTFYTDKAKNTSITAKKVAYVLKKIVEENDEKVYPLWINKYAELQFDIMAARYAK